MELTLEQTWTPLSKWCYVPSLVEIDPTKMLYAYDENNDVDDGQRTKFDQKSSFEPSVKVSLNKLFRS